MKIWPPCRTLGCYTWNMAFDKFFKAFVFIMTPLILAWSYWNFPVLANPFYVFGSSAAVSYVWAWSMPSLLFSSIKRKPNWNDIRHDRIAKNMYLIISRILWMALVTGVMEYLFVKFESSPIDFYEFVSFIGGLLSVFRRVQANVSSIILHLVMKVRGINPERFILPLTMQQAGRGALVCQHCSHRMARHRTGSGGFAGRSVSLMEISSIGEPKQERTVSELEQSLKEAERAIFYIAEEISNKKT